MSLFKISGSKSIFKASISMFKSISSTSIFLRSISIFTGRSISIFKTNTQVFRKRKKYIDIYRKYICPVWCAISFFVQFRACLFRPL